MISRFASHVKRNGEKVINFLVGWYKIAAVLGLSYALILWLISFLFPELQKIIIQLGLVAVCVVASVIVFVPLFWTIFRNRIARKKSLNPNIAIIQDATSLLFRADGIVVLKRELVLRPLVSGISHAQFHVSWAGKEADVSLLSQEGAQVSFYSPPTKAGLRIVLNFDRSLPKGRKQSHSVRFELAFNDPEHLIKPFNGYTSVYLAEERLTLGYAIEDATNVQFRRTCYSSLSSETPVIYEEHAEADGSHRWPIESPIHGFRYSLACLTPHR